MHKTFRNQNIDMSVRSNMQINNACDYLFNDSLFCLGSNDPRSVTFIDSLTMPALPLLADNKEQRAAYAKQKRNMIRKIIDSIKHVANEEASKPWIESKGYQLEDSDVINKDAMTIEEYEKLCEEDSSKVVQDLKVPTEPSIL